MRSVVVKAYEEIRQDGAVRLFKSYRKGVADGEQERDFLYVKDAADVLYELMRQRSLKGLFNLGSGKARSWNDLVRAVFAALGKPVRIHYIEMPEALRPKYQYHTLADMKWRQSLKGVSPFYSLEEGVEDYVQNYLVKDDPYL
jgi:ADP-L-glycero-D-manno-heptose 6-epimerase